MTLYEFAYETGSNAEAHGANWTAQTFTIGTVGTDEIFNLTSIKLKLYKEGNPGTVSIALKAVDVSNDPTGADLSTGTTTGNDLTTSSTGEDRDVTMTTYEMQASTQYAVLIKALSGNATNSVHNVMDFGGGGYTGGETLLSTDSGGSWTPLATSDSWFEVHGDKPGTNTQINIGDTWKEISAMKLNIGDVWKEVSSAQLNIGDTWKSLF